MSILKYIMIDLCSSTHAATSKEKLNDDSEEPWSTYVPEMLEEVKEIDKQAEARLSSYF